MSTVEDVPANGSTWTPVEAKKDPKSKRHAEAQERYREKNLETTRAKARERMQRLRANRTPEQVLKASENRRSSDADYNEHRRRLTDTENLAAPHDVLIFFKKSHALRRWKRHCMRRHTEDDHSNPRHCSDPDDGEDDGDDAPPRAHSAAPSVLRSTRSIGRAASAAARFDASPGNTADTDHTDDDMPPLLYGVEGDPEGINFPRGTRFSAHRYYVTRDQLDRSGVQSVTPANPLGQTSPAAKCRRGASASAVLPREHRSLVKRETPASPVTKIPLYCDMSDSELTDREVDQGDVFMAPASPVPMPPTISPTASTVFLPVQRLVGFGSVEFCPPCRATNGGPPVLPAGVWDWASQFQAPAMPQEKREPAPPSSISSPGAGAPAASTGTSSMRVLFNSTTRRLYPDPMQAFAEVKPGESLQVVGQEEVVEYCAGQSARLGS
ncbi:hypothetical protein B0H14DRAFT_3532293 [Mycena olivaceomarginata]|nr:hypothetical protein B0H14DRAFT_3532293 [Mycena olivaceomarginata]